MTPDLPSPSAFLADFGIRAEPEGVKEVSHHQVRQEVKDIGVSPEFYDLLVQYCASYIQAYELSDVEWGQLARRLGTHSEFLREAAHAVNAENERLWRDVLAQRIKRVSAAKVFRDGSWERLEATALNRLLTLAEKGMIRDTGELLAIATHAHKANAAPTAPAQTQVNINFGGDSMNDENGLPGAGAKMTIDLSPRLANSLSQRRETLAGADRVIDGQMLSAQELRDALTNRNAVTIESTEGDADE